MQDLIFNDRREGARFRVICSLFAMTCRRNQENGFEFKVTSCPAAPGLPSHCDHRQRLEVGKGGGWAGSGVMWLRQTHPHFICISVIDEKKEVKLEHMHQLRPDDNTFFCNIASNCKQLD